MKKRAPLPFADYQRIYQVIYTVLESSGLATTHRACLFFASAGMLILREHYGKEATLSAGCMALMVDEKSANVLVYGRQADGEWLFDNDAFHAWVQCDGWLIDFMAPIMGKALKEDGSAFSAPRRMLQKPLSDRKTSIPEIQHEGDFFCWHDTALTEGLLDNQPLSFSDLIRICVQWYRKPPKPLPDMGIGGGGEDVRLVLRAPSINGVW